MFMFSLEEVQSFMQVVANDYCEIWDHISPSDRYTLACLECVRFMVSPQYAEAVAEIRDRRNRH